MSARISKSSNCYSNTDRVKGTPICFLLTFKNANYRKGIAHPPLQSIWRLDFYRRVIKVWKMYFMQMHQQRHY